MAEANPYSIEEMRGTLKQRLFVVEYCKDWNATQAAIRAGYSEDTAGKIGGENLQKPEIARQIGERVKAIAEAAGIHTEGVLLEVWKVATATPDDAKMFKLEPKLKACELLLKHMGAITEKHEHSFTNELTKERILNATADELRAMTRKLNQLEPES